jgi:thioredoxin 1
MSNMTFLGFFKKKSNDNSYNQKTPSNVEWPEYIVNLNEKTFDDFIQKYPLSLIDFWASWCAPCKTMAPRLRKLSKIYKARVAFGKLDVQENKDIAKKYKVSGIPHLIFFKYGEKISSITGLKSVYDLKNVIEDILKR